MKKTYQITETLEYEISALSADEAERRALADDAWRSASVIDRHIEEVPVVAPNPEIEPHTPNLYDSGWLGLINRALEDRDVPVRITDISDGLWDEFLGPMLDSIEDGAGNHAPVTPRPFGDVTLDDLSAVLSEAPFEQNLMIVDPDDPSKILYAGDRHHFITLLDACRWCADSMFDEVETWRPLYGQSVEWRLAMLEAIGLPERPPNPRFPSTPSPSDTDAGVPPRDRHVPGSDQ